MKRLFLGIELNEAARAAVIEVQERLRAVATRQGVRFVRPEKIHLTLVFLGPQTDEAVEEIGAVCGGLCQRHRRLELGARGLGGFPGLLRPKVLWCGLDGDIQTLRMLQLDLATNLAAYVDPEVKGFSPHLTLARISPGSKEVGRLAGSIAVALEEREIARWVAEEVVLFESTPDGRYDPLARWPLL